MTYVDKRELLLIPWLDHRECSCPYRMKSNVSIHRSLSYNLAHPFPSLESTQHSHWSDPQDTWHMLSIHESSTHHFRLPLGGIFDWRNKACIINWFRTWPELICSAYDQLSHTLVSLGVLWSHVSDLGLIINGSSWALRSPRCMCYLALFVIV